MAEILVDGLSVDPSCAALGYMAAIVSIQSVPARKLAAVRRQVVIRAVGSAWRPALDQVWKFLGSQPGLRTDGHNIFLYHHPPAAMRL